MRPRDDHAILTGNDIDWKPYAVRYDRETHRVVVPITLNEAEQAWVGSVLAMWSD